jgi:hypothetical protein
MRAPPSVGCLPLVPSHAGLHAAAAGLAACPACAAGKYQPRAAQTYCLECAPGSSAARAGALACAKCPAGKFTPLAAQAVCTVCPMGRFAAAGDIACHACEPGQARGASTAANGFGGWCDDCLRGTAQAQRAQPSCGRCPAGRAAARGGAAACEACGAGRFQPLTGQGMCVDCPFGRYVGGSRGRVNFAL